MDILKFNSCNPLHCISSGRFVSGQDWCHARRKIDSYVLLAGLQGSAFIRQDDQYYEVKPGTMLVLLPDHTHEGFMKSPAGTSYYWCHFNSESKVEFMDHQDMRYEIARWETNKYEGNIFLPVYFELSNTERLSILFKQLIHAQNYSKYAKFQTNLFLTSISAEITEQIFEKFNNPLSSTDTSRFNEAFEWIRINYNQNISVHNIAEKFNYNPNYFSRVFKEYTGLPILRYINSLRLEKAKFLLTNTDQTIKEITSQLGFEDEKYFMKQFKQHENLTPTQYRNAFFYIHLNNH